MRATKGTTEHPDGKLLAWDQETQFLLPEDKQLNSAG